MEVTCILFITLYLIQYVSPSNSGIYMNQFAVHIPDGKHHADAIAGRHGFDIIGQIGSLKGYYLLEHKRIHKRSLSHSQEHHEKLSNEPQVKWFEQQKEKRRKKRDLFDSFFSTRSQQGANIFDVAQPGLRSTTHVTFLDPLFKEEWYLNGGAKDGYDMNISPAWSQGYTGKGVVVSILDDGIQTNHPDLALNYDPKASTDINDNDDDPMPRDNGDNKHGTRCAGEVASIANNNFCGVGVAYNASIGGVRMLDGSVNDAVEARALSLNPNHVDIYSASWGPEDDGKTVDGPGPLARRAFINGVTTGRNGKGSIFVWASGNGGRHTDNCNCDGYTNSIFTLSISSATQGGYKPWYLEECSSTIATTYSSGTPGHDKSVATVDMDGRLRPDHLCTAEHTGTSASAPLASGICALALEANPELTWRDMQHIVIMTSNPAPLLKESGWITNGVKRKVSHKFGYGLMDGGAMVNLAKNWVNVPAQHICKSNEVHEDRNIDPKYGSVLTTYVEASGCPTSVNEVQYIEHVQCKISLRFFPRGNLRIILISPSGTASTLLMERPRDIDSSNFDDWPFLSVHFWGENPKGMWTLQVVNAGNRHVNREGVLRKWQLIFYGTSTNPVRNRSKPKTTNYYGESPAILPNFYPTSGGFYQPSGFQQFNPIFQAAGSENEPEKVLPDGETTINELSKDTGCHESCATCAGPGQDSCLTCASGLLYITDMGLCLQRCPEGYFEDLDSKSCVSCKGYCASCPDDPSVCSSCDHHLILYNGTCIASCPNGTYETDDYRCNPCDPECETCMHGGKNGCITCKNGTTLHSGRCKRRNYDCQNENCNWCVGDSCGECRKGFAVNSQGQCLAWFYAKCDSDEYSTIDGCKPCMNGTVRSDRCLPRDPFCPHAHCKWCIVDLCAECDDGYVLDPAGNCLPYPLADCKPGNYKTEEGCKPCIDLNNCTKCPSNLFILNNTCVTSCGSGYYGDSGWCKKCSEHCAECQGDQQDQCLFCKSGYKITPDGTCLEMCPSGTYTTSWGCTKCHHFCSTCNGEGPYSCTSCSFGRYLDAASKICMPCKPCTAINKHQCCHCDKITGLCHLPAGKRRITSEQAARAHEDELIAEASTLDVTQSFAPQYSNITALVIGACATVVVLFGIIFAVLQSKSNSVRKGGYTKIPINEMKFSTFSTSQVQSRINLKRDVMEYQDDDDEDNLLTTKS